MLRPRRGVRGELGVARASGARAEVEDGRAWIAGRAVGALLVVELAMVAYAHF